MSGFDYFTLVSFCIGFCSGSCLCLCCNNCDGNNANDNDIELDNTTRFHSGNRNSSFVETISHNSHPQYVTATAYIVEPTAPPVSLSSPSSSR